MSPQFIFIESAKGHIHKGGLVVMPRAVRDKDNAHLTAANFRIKFANEIIGRHGTANTTANDDYIFYHYRAPFNVDAAAVNIYCRTYLACCVSSAVKSICCKTKKGNKATGCRSGMPAALCSVSNSGQISLDCSGGLSCSTRSRTCRAASN